MQRMDVQGVIDALGVPPARVADLKGLMGDTSDNIPGVPRIGPKTAVKLLQEYGTLENVLANADAIKGQVGENLRTYSRQARLSKELSIIRTDAPAVFDEEAARRRRPDMEALTELAAAGTSQSPASAFKNKWTQKAGEARRKPTRGRKTGPRMMRRPRPGPSRGSTWCETPGDSRRRVTLWLGYSSHWSCRFSPRRTTRCGPRSSASS